MKQNAKAYGSHGHADEIKEQRRCVVFDGVFDHDECRAPD